MMAAIRMPVLPPDDVCTTFRLSGRGSEAEGRGSGFSGSASVGGIGLRGSRGSVLRAGLAITVSPLLRIHHNARNGKRFHDGSKRNQNARTGSHGRGIWERGRYYSARISGTAGVAGGSAGTSITGVDCGSLATTLATTVLSISAERWNSHADAAERLRPRAAARTRILVMLISSLICDTSLTEAGFSTKSRFA